MNISITFMGFDFVCEVDYTVTSYGSPAHMGSMSYPGHPAEPPEWEVESIYLHRDNDGGFLNDSRAFEATGALFDCLAENDKIREAVRDEIQHDEGRDYDRA